MWRSPEERFAKSCLQKPCFCWGVLLEYGVVNLCMLIKLHMNCTKSTYYITRPMCLLLLRFILVNDIACAHRKIRVREFVIGENIATTNWSAEASSF